jgi:GDP-L-fucose synthase
MAANVIEGARLAGVRKLLFLGSSCIYPKLAAQPIREDSLLTGPLEVTNEAYAVAKIAGIKLCDHARAQHGCDFISAMPCNLYGTGDNFSLENSHVLPAMIRKMHEAKLRGEASLKLWGTGTPLREFLHADDLAEACLMLLDRYSQPGHINVGSGEELTIRELAGLVAQAVGSTRRCPTARRASSWTSRASAPSVGSTASPWPTVSATLTPGISRTRPKRGVSRTAS